ncbi:translesion DNA synthesis-associated protein ImuA [Rivibacter subsaxonicus]|uniref:Protein ImuA n=1 Tax=Rivibacter subsaxonicus TaxID=457575 RepID=A0A4Q7VD00_9BURK|nr:translesion DNA synthesis-associated protein ImuA [Rivibacter subsaxonicus]RZT93767.1 protein ImuA [Rivibacter subsaxonicus]
MSSSLALLDHHGPPTMAPLWRADRMVMNAPPGLPSGHAALDAQLPGGGWPATGLSELLGEAGLGELRLLRPLMQKLAAQQQRELLWIAPPGLLPSAAAFEALGLPLASLLWVEPRSSADAAWAVEQALRGGAAALVLWWCQVATTATLRRLHLAAQDVPLFLLGPPAWRERSSPAPLRIACRAEADGRLALDIFKRRGPPLGKPLSLDLPWPVGAKRPAALPPRIHPTVLPVASHAVAGRRSATVAAASPALAVATGA